MNSHPSSRRRPDDPNTSDIASARLAPRRIHDDERGDVLAGGDASKAPQSLREQWRERIVHTSSGTSWDDPDEL
ncbi:hypothetical protein CLV28_1613 [Sediminihabitans luteus]|uniref:Uncharacterized protein n=1 Tax=Sediminihabitans luteus TaxID=1138585 RepID=A0A2M9CQE3_9CELL|nr:hypothetical protein [Sediminihabitans luteus]PJJ74124.1 hypothetical protein CLV28_1613 [Sediminihabitans luteus]GII97960.1 hypothetical protein Slu03_03380 [Sediminihabitans luteus]